MPIHSKRIWSIVPAESAEWLAEQLTQCTWCGCNGFRLGIYVLVNDTTCADGSQEYGVLREDGDHYVQIESLTFSWMTYDEAESIIRRVLAVNSTRQSTARSPESGFRRRTDTAAAIGAHDDGAVSVYSNRPKARGFCTPPGLSCSEPRIFFRWESPTRRRRAFS